MLRLRPLLHLAALIPSAALFLAADARATEVPLTITVPHLPRTPVAKEAPASPAKAKATPPPAEEPAAKPASEPSTEIRGLLNLGASLTERGDYETAEIAYRQAMNASEVDVEDLKTALLGLAYMHRRQGALTKAVAIYEKFLKDYPNDARCPEALLDQGRTLRDMGAYKRANSTFYSVINATLKLPSTGFEHYQLLAKTAQYEIAETCFRAGEFAEANKFFSRLSLLDLAPPDRANVQFKAAYALQLQGDNEAAVVGLRTFLSEWPDDENVPEARYLLAVTLRTLNRREQALNATLDLLRTEKSQLATNPKRWIYWQRRTGNQLANDFFENGDTFNAQMIYKGLVALSDDPSWRLPITYQIGLCDERLGNVAEARSAYQSIIDATGANTQADFAELVRMAGWHLDNLNWREKFGQKVATVFETTTGSQRAAASSVKSAALP